ncbi:ABC transporter substrate-binding protein [Achromobacter pestifer]|uniref:Glutathione-binding protein GsiB n=1 Tax=Achromobacter pestifer TaxID=1353889 RepID=A0A6S6YS34_9BURK|nr:ABC transporter substrate-binding protein [Achromobacter pestifer]CAB3639481.1 Glutathione-binding protein GsiB [Achromobacter pestifer]
MNRRDFLIASAATAGWWSGSAAVPAWAAAARNGVLNIAVQPEPPGLMLGIIQNGPTQMIGGNIYESLLRYDEKLEPMPSLATSWTVNDTATVYTFKLKEGVLWHDGKPFTAHDVVFSVDQFLRKTHARLRAGLAFVDSIKALDDHTVEFRLPRPFGPFLGLFETGTMPMVPRHIYEGTDYLSNPANNTPIGTGPYKFKEWRRGSFIQLVRNEQYHEPGLPSVETVYFHVIPDAASRAAAFESGKLDILPGGTVEYFDIERLKSLPNVDITTKGWEFFGPHSFMWLNNRHPVLADVRVRRAIMYALDREAMRNVAWYGFGKVATGPFNSTVRYHTDNVTRYPRDVARAKQLLKEAGYKGQTLRLLPLPYGETWQRFAEIARQNLAEAGIKLEMTATDVAGWSEKTANWDYDIAFCYLYQYGDAALGVSRNYLTSTIAKGSPWNNVEGYSNPKVDDLLERGSRESDPEVRRQLYEEAQRILVDDVPVAWLLELQFPTLYRNNINNLINSGIGINDSLARAKLV